MVIRVKKSNNFNVSEAHSIVNFTACRYLICHELITKEQILNNYLIKKYNKNLKSICLWLLKNATFSEDFDGNLIITFKTIEQNKLAELITYGNLEVKGCDILRNAFGERI